MKKSNKIEKPMLPYFKGYCKAILLKKMWEHCKDRQIDKWKNRESKNRQTFILSTDLFYNVTNQFNGTRIILSVNLMLEQLTIHKHQKQNSASTIQKN